MAITDIPWIGLTDDKLYLQSGTFTSTLKTSEYVGGTEANPSGIAFDGTNSLWTGFNTDKLHLNSGQFTSTVLDSESITAIEPIPQGISWDGTDTPWCGGSSFVVSHLYLQSGGFTSTLKTSRDVTAVDHTITDISFDGVDTPWIGTNGQRLYLQSGQFSSTLKTSWQYNAIDSTGKGISFNGTDTLWAGAGAVKLYLQSGQFSSTVKTSEAIGSIDTQPNGVDTNNADARLGIISDTYSATTLALTAAEVDPALAGFPVDVIMGAALSLSGAANAIASVTGTAVISPSALTIALLQEGLAIIAGVDLSISVLPLSLGIDVDLLSPTISGDVILFLPGVTMISQETALSLHAPEVSVTNDIKIVVTNARTFAISEYTAMAYNSMAKFNGKYLYAKADGIYEGGGDNDNGADIAAGYKTGTFDINATEVQKLRNIWMNYRSDGDIKLFSVGNEVNARWYPFVNSTNGTIHERRQKFERGIRDNHFSFGISNVAGSSFEIKTAKILTEPIRKRR